MNDAESKKIIKLPTPGTLASGASTSGTSTSGAAEGRPMPFRIRDQILFHPGDIYPERKYPIIITPSEGRGAARVERIIMHRSIATKLVLEAIVHGSNIIQHGSGSCEVFLAEGVPNWTPEGIVITKEAPLVLHVFNPTAPAPGARPLRVIGNCVVLYRGEVAQ